MGFCAVMSARHRFTSLLAGHDPGVEEGLLVDLGTSTLTGVCAAALPELEAGSAFGHPVIPTLPLSAADCARLGSDFARAGLVFAPPSPSAGEFTDLFGVDWLVAEGGPAPLRHPLEKAGLGEVARHPRPVWPRRAQVVEAGAEDRLVVADAPCPGMLEMCFNLRNGWRFLEDLTANWQVASALLDWSLETIVAAYGHMLGLLPAPPDVVIYGDDYGYEGGMFLSDVDFRTHLRPRLRTLLSRLRRLTPAAVCLHCCGAIRPIAADLADLGVEIVNFDFNARGMGTGEMRRKLPRALVFHSAVDLVMLGRVIDDSDHASAALFAVELASCVPAIAAPPDNLGTPEELAAAVRGAAFVRALSAGDLATLRRFGPVREVVERAIQAAVAAAMPEWPGSPATFVPY
jgi:hypothetical protein